MRAQVVPPISSAGLIGFGSLHLSDTNELSYNFIECHLYGGDVTAIHIHGPAAPGEIGPILYTIPTPSPYYGFISGVLGVVNDQQLHDLNCGLWYVDIHTVNNPLGEVRGRIRGQWGWYVRDPCSLPTDPVSWGQVKVRYR